MTEFSFEDASKPGEFTFEQASAEKPVASPLTSGVVMAPLPIPTGYIQRATGGFSHLLNDTADVFMGGLSAAVKSPGQIAGFGDTSTFQDLAPDIERRLREAGASEEEAKAQTKRLMTRYAHSEGVTNIFAGPLQAITAPLFGAFRSFISRPVEEKTGIPMDVTEGLGMVAMAAAGMRGTPHSVARVTVDPKGNVTAQKIGALPKPEDFKAAAETLGSDKAESNLRTLWDEQGIHPAEAVHDAQRDAFVRQEVAPPSFAAYHGSAHAFEEFDISKVGTGQGAQSYGHGLYFAENPKVAETYRREGSDAKVNGMPFNPDNALHRAVGLLDEAGGSREKALAEAKRLHAWDAPFYDDVESHLASGRPLPELEGSANFYRVRINANKEHFLDWDKPLSEQPEAVQKMMREHADTSSVLPSDQRVLDALQKDPKWKGKWDEDRTWRYIRDLYPNMSEGAMQQIADRVQQHVQTGTIPETTTGERIYQALAGKLATMKKLPPDANGSYKFDTGEAAASNALLQAGIPGIKYLDQHSRGRGTFRTKEFEGKFFVESDALGREAGPFDTRDAARAWIGAQEKQGATHNIVLFDHNLVEITEKNGRPLVPTKVQPVQGSPVPEGTPRSELAKTGLAHVDRIIESAKHLIDNAVIDDTHDVPYSAGGSVPMEDPTVFIDRHFPRSFEIDGVRWDPAEPFAVHENVEQETMEKLIAGGMAVQPAYKVSHFEFAEKAEGAWYRAHGIDQARAEEAYRPYIDQIQHENPENPPPNLFTKPYPHDDVKGAKGEPLVEPKPTKEEIAQAMAILGEDRPLRALGADVVGEGEDMPSLAQQPSPSPGRLLAKVNEARSRLFDIGRDLQMLVAPMATGSPEARAIAKDFASAMRRNRWEWQRVDSDVAKRFKPEQRKRMYDANDEESVALQTGESREHQGLVTLTDEERAAVADMQAASQASWLRAVDVGLVEGEGLPSYGPRMVMNVAIGSDRGGPIPLNGVGLNLRTQTAQMKRRKYLTAEETEAAAKRLVGDRAARALKSDEEIQRAIDDVRIARDIRSLPLATARLDDAVAGRGLINSIKEYGQSTGADTVTEGGIPAGATDRWFTIDHPAFRTWRPAEFEIVDGKSVPKRDANGDIIFKQVPLYVRGDFEGPLRAVLSQRTGAAYGALMSLKGKTMSLIMNSPAIHNFVEWGRAFPAMPGKLLTFRVYFDGNKAKNNLPLMREAIDAGLVPIGKRFFNQDITSIMEAPDLTPGRSWTAQIAGFAPGLFDEGAGNATKAAIDKAGDFWHNTLLWDRIADLQMGLYVNMRAGLLKKGVDAQTSARVAAHWANRYAGALPQEAMSDGARKIANVLLFSRSFTLGNLGVMKDMFTGLPKDVLAQIERDGGFREGSISAAEEGTPGAAVKAFTKGMAKRKAMAVVALDIGLLYVGNSILQSAVTVLKGDNTLGKELSDYAARFSQAMTEVTENPLKLLQPFNVLQSLTPNEGNEPGKQDRALIGHNNDGTAVYARNPTGKIGEEFTGWTTAPLDMIRRKLGTIARPVWQILANDKGFGRKVYDPGADTPLKYVANLGRIVAHLAMSQVPEGQFSAVADIVKSQLPGGDPLRDPLTTVGQAVGPLAGVTFSKGAPGGPAVGEMYAARLQHQFAMDAALPDIRKQILRGDIEGANARMTELGISPGLQNFYRRTALNPSTRLSGKALRDFYLYSTPEQKVRMDRQLDRQQPSALSP